jgi:hypothetical protein
LVLAPGPPSRGLIVPTLGCPSYLGKPKRGFFDERGEEVGDKAKLPKK